MGKIRQLREDILLESNSQDKIYPITYAKAVYMDNGKTAQEEIKSIERGESLKDNSINTRHIVDNTITTDKIIKGAITSDKLSDNSVETDKIVDLSITANKIANGTLTLDKIDEDLKVAIEAATGLPENMLERLQNLSESVAKLQDTTFPITLSLNVAFNNPNHTIYFAVKNEGKDFVGDTLSLEKTLANGTIKTLWNTPVASGSVQSIIESNREVFTLKVTASGHTSKSTSATKYICYAGGSNEETISNDVINTLVKYSTGSVSFNPSVTTEDNQYIWIVVPNYLTVNRVTSQGFDVTFQAAQSITTSLGTFKAYRTANTLTAQTWKLVIS